MSKREILLPPQSWDSEHDAYHGGNSDNRAHYGTFYLNLNNTVRNANWNIEAALSYRNRNGN